MEYALVLVLFALGLAALLYRSARRPGQRAYLAVLVLLTTSLAAVAHHRRSPKVGGLEDPATEVLPAKVKQFGYVSSDACRTCHPSQYASWHRSYHRTMTQVVTPETMLAKWDGTTLTWRDKEYDFERVGDEFWVDMVDPEWHKNGPGLNAKKIASANRTRRVRKRVVMSTGSHNQQVYWMGTEVGRELNLLPFTWLVPEGRWYPYELSFLRPDQPVEMTEVWNVTCIKCHATGGQPAIDVDTGVPHSRVTELGIACEACHGPGAEHIRANQDPARRYRLHLTDKQDSTIVNPAKLSADRSTQACGQCHAVTELDTRERASEWVENGFPFRPGDDLAATRWVMLRPPEDQPLDPAKQTYFDSFTWPDGVARVSGRDYSGLLKSPCFHGGKLSCLSCHSMHESDPNEQLARDRTGDEGCLQCHGKLGERIAEHTHHPAGSSGSRCYNCHMPYTTYGLFKAIRSHTPGLSPNVVESIKERRPNACNLCHLDKSLAWTGEHLEQWYGEKHVELGDEERARSAAALWLLRGDAGQRGLVAWNMGWKPAVEASAGRDWLAPLLIASLDDPYAAVRLISYRSLQTLPGFERFAYDFAAPRSERRRAMTEGERLWAARAPARTLAGPVAASLFLDSAGKLRTEDVERTVAWRDNRVVNLGE